MSIPIQRQRGFTLLELIVVITIIGLLSGAVVVSTRHFGPQGRRLRIDRDLRQILTAAEAIHLSTGSYPDTIEEMVRSKGSTKALVELESVPKDPWQRDYLYEVVDDEPRVTCLGKDGQPGGTEGETVDIVLPARDLNA